MSNLLFLEPWEIHTKTMDDILFNPKCPLFLEEFSMQFYFCTKIFKVFIFKLIHTTICSIFTITSPKYFFSFYMEMSTATRKH
jgi:hypothetical protein